MNKNSIIIYSAIIIGVFALLFYLENPEKKTKSEVSSFLKQYEGEQGIVVLKVPDFLLGEIIKTDSLNLDKSSFRSFRIMILHENENEHRSCVKTERRLDGFLDSLKFQPVMEAVQTDSTRMKIYNKDIVNAWKENVTVYTSDSTLFLFNYISDINNDQVKKFSDHLSNQNLL
jgi:hypothetical protein